LTSSTSTQEVPLERRTILALAALVVAIHIATNVFSPYGIHRDEFLYLAMGRHLHLFRMEFPPAIAILAKISMLFGDSLVAIRIFPALTAGLLVALAALTASNLGGGRLAQILAALSVVASPLFLRAGNLFQPVIFDQLWWTIGLFALVKLGRTEDRRWWIVYGVAVGLGLLTKFSAIFFGAATLLALAVSPQRRWLMTRWPWIAAALVILIGSPSVIGQIRLGFPVIQQMHDLRAGQLDRVTPAEFILGQVEFGPAFFLALGGLLWLLISAEARRFRVAGWTCVFAFLILLALKGKSYYLGPIYPALFGAGGVAIERLPRFRKVAAWIAASLVVAYGLLLLPIGIPILPPVKMIAYTRAIGASEANRTNRGELGDLPQDYADMLGWPEQAAAVASVYNSLSPEERAKAVIIADNYGEAGALDFYGPRYRLPNAVSAAGTYWFFGPGTRPGEVAVTIGVGTDDLKPFYREATVVRRITHPWTVSEERDVPIIVARGPYHTLQEVWPSLAGQN
jgi:hypothetical protein